MGYIALASEDELSEAVGSRLTAEANLEVTQWLGRKGNGCLRSRLEKYVDMAQHHPVLLLTDLDSEKCPLHLMAKWFNGSIRPMNLLFRVAVRETETWLLADRAEIASFLCIQEKYIPLEPEALPDPKRALLTAARRAPRRIREELVVAKGSMASQGIGYNNLLGQFVNERWNPERAAHRSPSLSRARQRIHELAARMAA
jgi:hypothetical protein